MKNQAFKGFALAFICFLTAIFQSAHAQVQTARYVSMTSNTNAYYEYLPQGYNATGTQKYPLILFMHGMGELGAGTTSTLPKILNSAIPRLINRGDFPTSFTVNGQTHRFIVISPQFVAWPSPANIDAVLNYVVTNYNVDVSRIYLTGLSMGGGATWEYAGNQTMDAYAKRLAAIVPICGASYPSVYRANVIAKNNLPVWAFHNSGDPTAPVYYTNDYVAGINAYVPAPVPPAKKTIFNSSSHDAWTQAYNPTYRENGMNVYEWMLQYSRSGSTTPPANTPPVANAGTDQSITLPASSVQLSGSASDPGGSITSYSWTRTSGPTQFAFNNSAIASPTVSNLVQGSYTFRLTVTDNQGATDTDDVIVIVNGPVTNPPPSGTTKAIKVNIFGGSNSYSNAEWNNWNTNASRTSSPFKYSDGSTSGISAVISTQNAVSDNGSSYATTMAPREVGRYASYSTTNRTVTFSGLDNSKTYNLEVYGSRSGISNNTTRFTAGGTSVEVKTDNNYSKAASFNAISPSGGQIVLTLTRLNTYNYINGFILTENGSGAPGNNPPTVTAGTDQVITLPASSVQLAGTASDADGTIVSYNWTKIAGPSQFTFNNAFILNPTVSNLAAGSYTFRFTATDNLGATSSDDVNVVVNGSTTPPPPPPSGESKYIRVNIFGGSNAYTNSEWNNWNTSASRNSAAFKYSDGSTSTVSAVLSAQNAVADNSTTHATTMAPPQVGRYTSYSTSTRTLTISGLDNSKTYHLEVYASRKGVSNNTTRFTLGGSSTDLLTDNNLDEKVAFNSVTPSGGQIVLTLAKLNTYNYLNGFTLTEVGSGTASSSIMSRSIAETETASTELGIYPNPVTDRFLLQTNTTETGTMQVLVIDMNGITQKQFNLSKNQQGPTQTYISIGQLKPGEYIIKVQVGNWMGTRKISKL